MIRLRDTTDHINIPQPTGRDGTISCFPDSESAVRRRGGGGLGSGTVAAQPGFCRWHRDRAGPPAEGQVTERTGEVANTAAPLNLDQKNSATNTDPATKIGSLLDRHKKKQSMSGRGKGSARAVPSATGKFFATTSRALPSLPSVVWPAVVVSSVFLA